MQNAAKNSIKIKITAETEFHLIAIAHGATEPCKSIFLVAMEDSWLIAVSLVICTSTRTVNHFALDEYLTSPQEFIHVFDDVSYVNVLHELDTIQDFLRYLEARQKLFVTKHIIAESESDILAQHLRGDERKFAHFTRNL